MTYVIFVKNNKLHCNGSKIRMQVLQCKETGITMTKAMTLLVCFEALRLESHLHSYEVFKDNFDTIRLSCVLTDVAWILRRIVC